jgi:hypothetical protein
MLSLAIIFVSILPLGIHLYRLTARVNRMDRVLEQFAIKD